MIGCGPFPSSPSPPSPSPPLPSSSAVPRTSRPGIQGFDKVLLKVCGTPAALRSRARPSHAFRSCRIAPVALPLSLCNFCFPQPTTFATAASFHPVVVQYQMQSRSYVGRELVSTYLHLSAVHACTVNECSMCMQCTAHDKQPFAGPHQASVASSAARRVNQPRG